jgi:hypothetical protein
VCLVRAIPTFSLHLALYSTFFDDTKEVAFSIYTMMQGIAFAVVYLYSSALLVRVSIILQIIYTGLALICYVVVEIRAHRTPKNNEKFHVLHELVETHINI